MATRVRLLGRPAILIDDAQGEKVELPPGKTSALLHYLTYQRGRVPREDLVDGAVL
jgi:DNA-binding SARP family transcriptional activator